MTKVVQFKEKFYKDNWAHYDEISKGLFKLIPPSYRLIDLKEDYEMMKEMIFNDPPKFDVIIDKLKKIEEEINLLINDK